MKRNDKVQIIVLLINLQFHKGVGNNSGTGRAGIEYSPLRFYFSVMEFFIVILFKNA